MRLPGLDQALSNLDRMQNEMIPLLERIARGVDRMVELQEQQSERNNT